MRVNGKKLRANVTFASGRLYAVELPKPIKLYRDKSVELGAVLHGSQRQSRTRAIEAEGA